MRVITLRTQIRGLADKIKQQWQKSDGSWMQIRHTQPDTQKIHAAVAALDSETATREDVVAAMGFGGWVAKPQCHECDRVVDAVVQIGEELQMESATANACEECLRKALAAIEAER